MSFFEAETVGYVLRIKLAPGASFNGFRGVFCDEKGVEFLKGCVTAVPEKSKANKALIELLSKTLKISRSQISLVSGETDHYKKIYINTVVSGEFSAKLSGLIKE